MSLFRWKSGKRPPSNVPLRIPELDRAGELMASHRYDDALVPLRALAQNPPQRTDFDPSILRSLVLGQIATCYFQTLRAEEALPIFEEAMTLCRQTGDLAGIRAHLSNRLETLRWLDRHLEAVPLAEELANLWEEVANMTQAVRYRSRSRVMARGEPLLRIIIGYGGRFMELDEFSEDFHGRAEFVFERNRLPLQRCLAFDEEGRRYGEAGDHDRALASFAAAAAADPFEPGPHYDSGFTHMLQGRYPEAIRSLETTERLAPGWYQVRWDSWLAHQLENGRFHATVPLALRQLEGSPPETGLELGRLLTDRFPDLAGAWALMADHLRTVGRKEEALAAIQTGLAVAEEPDVRSRLLVALASSDPAHHRAELEEAASQKGNLSAAAAAHVYLAGMRDAALN